MNELTEAVPLHCANCGTPMQGEFCHHCGQSVHSVLKPVHHMVEDTLDMVLHVDSRIVHTLPPLLFKPGFLTLEYFSGRRQRYVAPFRLMFVLCLLAFFVAHLALGDAGLAVGQDAVTVQTEAFKQAKTPAEVDRALQDQLTGLDQAQRLPAVGALTREQLDKARHDLQQEAIKRRAELGDKSVVLLGPSADAQHIADGRTRKPQDDSVHVGLDAPVRIGWLPDFLNARLDRMVRRMGANWNAIIGNGDRAAEARERLEGQLFATLPQTLFFMLPLFALLLKLLYVFRRRLYMEHLIVALHSHAFLFLAMLLGVLLDLLAGWLVPLAGWMAPPLHWLGWGLVLWVPVYLLIMQKRIYRQGWPMTLFKYLVAGCCYLWLLSAVVVAAFMLSLGY
jgi:hypothetical protein